MFVFDTEGYKGHVTCPCWEKRKSKPTKGAKRAMKQRGQGPVWLRSVEFLKKYFSTFKVLNID